MKWGRKPLVDFSCNEEDYEAVAKPVPASKALPGWYKRLPRIDSAEVTTQVTGKTVKTCMPFFDAMALGWVLGAPVEFTINVTENGGRIDAGWRYANRPILDSHQPFQIRGHPREGHLVLRMFMMWSVHTPPGYSVLVTAPFNRTDLPFEALTGVIDTDKSNAILHLPMFCNLPDGLHVIEKGTPVVQVIPFKRETFASTITQETPEETAASFKQLKLLMSESGGYRKHLRARRHHADEGK